MKDFDRKYEEATKVFIPKGENRSRVTELLVERGEDLPEFTGRLLTVSNGRKEFGLRRDKDLPVLLGRDTNALGFMGDDRFEELSATVRADLGFVPVIETHISFAIAAKSDRAQETSEAIRGGSTLTIATSYPNRVQVVAEELGFGISEIVELGGSVESAQDDDPSIDAIFDIVDSGNTLRENDMAIIQRSAGTLSVGAVWSTEAN